MKKIYLICIPVLLLSAACSKDFLKRYDKRITGGTWELYDIDNFGLGSRYTSHFYNGRFIFEDDGGATYIDNDGVEYYGYWDIRKEYNGDDQYRSLFVTVQNDQLQEVKSEYFDNIQFTGTNRFRAFIYNGGRTYTYKFKR